MEIDIFGFRLELDRAICNFCMAIDFITLTLLILAIQTPLVIPMFATALGFSFIGIFDEIRYQASTINMFGVGKMYDLLAIELSLVTLISFIFIFYSATAAIAFLVGSTTLFFINRQRYKTMSIYYDFVMIILFIIEILVFL
jgi:hypothetical protein